MLARRLHLSAAPVLRRLSTKSSTGIVGMEVRPDAPEILLSLYSKTLAELESLPAEAGYRSAVEALTKGRMAAVEGAKSIEEIETAIGGGQVEQLIQQAEHELQLIPTMRDARVWEAVPESAILAEELYTDLKRRGVALQRADIPQQQSHDYPTAQVDLAPELPSPTPSRAARKAGTVAASDRITRTVLSEYSQKLLWCLERQDVRLTG